MVEYEKPKSENGDGNSRWKSLMDRTRSLYDRIWGNRGEMEKRDGE